MEIRSIAPLRILKATRALQLIRAWWTLPNTENTILLVDMKYECFLPFDLVCCSFELSRLTTLFTFSFRVSRYSPMDLSPPSLKRLRETQPWAMNRAFESTASTLVTVPLRILLALMNSWDSTPSNRMPEILRTSLPSLVRQTKSWSLSAMDSPLVSCSLLLECLPTRSVLSISWIQMTTWS